MSMRRALVIGFGLAMLAGPAAVGACSPDSPDKQTDGADDAPDGVVPPESADRGPATMHWNGPGAEHYARFPERTVESQKLSVGPPSKVKKKAAPSKGVELHAEKAPVGDSEGGESVGSLGALKSGESAGRGSGIGKLASAKSAIGGAKKEAAPTKSAAPDPPRAPGGSRGGSRPDTQRAGKLTAAEWSDLDNWAFWRHLYDPHDRQEETPDRTRHEDEWGIYTRHWAPVQVEHDGEPVVDARVRLEDADGELLWRARTDNEGHAELFPSLYSSGAREDLATPFRVVVESGEHRRVVDNVEANAGRRIIDLEGSEAPEPSLDLMFTVDTTGSMGDELRYLERELGDVVERVERRLDREVSLRVSANFYRDRTDEYVVRPHPFTREVDRVVRQMGAESATGGGDKPEAVDRALVESIRDHEWRKRATARLMFLVLDAPPHGGDQQLQRVRRMIRLAAERGIRIVPVVGSGIDKRTEFLMRFAAIATGGTYVFLTDDSGIGGDHLEPTIGDHEVRKLNDLLVDVITRYTQT